MTQGKALLRRLGTSRTCTPNQTLDPQVPGFESQVAHQADPLSIFLSPLDQPDRAYVLMMTGVPSGTRLRSSMSWLNTRTQPWETI